MEDVQTCEVDAKVAQKTWQHEILFADRSLKDEQLLTIPYI
jgi:hypothetical protein